MAEKVFGVLGVENDEKEEDEEKVTVCHNGKDLKVAYSAKSAHLNHGDTIGSCDDHDHSEHEHDDDKDDKYKDYGKTTDRAELQRQLHELLELLIKLLTEQMLNQS